MTKKILNFSVIFLLVVLASCEKETQYEVPLVFMGEVTNIDSTGATFSMKITALSESNITDYGFVWNSTNEPVLENGDHYSMQSLAETTTYSVPIKTTLISGQTYYVRAYTKSSNSIVYSKEVSFISLGSTAPTIKHFYPLSGNINDTIVIIGSNFSYNPQKNVVLFDKSYAKVIYTSQDTIKAIVPSSLNKSQYKIYVSILGNQSIAENNFELIAPTISDFSPQTAPFGSLITIKGTNLGLNSKQTKVCFGNTEATIIRIKNDEIVVKIPDLLNIPSCNITVVKNNIIATSNTTFTLPSITISDFSPKTAITGSQIKITGTNFSPIPQNNNVEFGGLKAEIISASANELIVILPLQTTGYYNSREISVSVSVLKTDRTFPSNLLVNDKWFRLKDSPINFDGSFCTISNNKAYLGINNDKGFWEFEPTTQIFTKLSNFPGASREGGNGFSIDKKIYFGTGISYMNYNNYKDFWEYEISTNSWTQKSDFMGEARNDAFSFSINKKGYFGGGVYNSLGAYNHPFNDFWEYNPETDSWSTLTSFNGEDSGSVCGMSKGISVVADEISYIGLGWNYIATPSGQEERWFSYNSLTQTWSQLTSFPSPRGYNKAIGFNLNGILYVKTVTSDFYNYNNTTNSWEKICTNLWPNRVIDISFSIGNFAYIGIGNELWEFDPSR